MPAKQTSSKLFSRMGDKARRAFEENKHNEVEYSSFGELPEGIENGIAQLVDISFKEIGEGKKNAGQLMFYAAGVVVSPEEHTVADAAGTLQTYRTAGLRTQIMEMLCETPESKGRKTFNEHFAWVMNELGKLGVSMKDMEFDNLEATVEALRGMQPYFKFRTWKGKPTAEYPNPRVNHMWNGLCDAPSNGQTNAVQDDTSEAPTAPVKSAAQTVKPTSTTKPANGKAQVKPATPVKAEPEPSDDYQLMELVQSADGGDGTAQGQLMEMGRQAGLTDEQMSEAADWSAVLDLINAATSGVGADEEPAESEWKPQVKEMYRFKPSVKGPGGKAMPGKKEIDVEVQAVQEAAKTVTLVSMEDRKTKFLNVKWDVLVVPES